MNDRPDSKILKNAAKIFFILGGIILFIVGIYADSCYESARHVMVSYRDILGNIYNLVFNILEMIRQEPIGAVLMTISIFLLLIGFILYAKGRHFE